MKKVILYLLFAGVYSIGLAQTLSNLRGNWYAIQSDTISIDTLSLVGKSYQVFDDRNNKIDTNDFEILPWTSKLVWKKKPNISQVKIIYRVYPMYFAAKKFHKDNLQYLATKDNFNIQPFNYSPEENTPFTLIDFGDLDYSGNFSRGFAFGNNQSVTLNSAFNLQMQGNLSKDLEVMAAITDNNIPIQPEGNTQQIQEFDKIFVQLKRGDHQVTVGDFDLYNPSTYFLRYSKKAQGGSYSGVFNFKKGGTLKGLFGGGVSKGKFARNTLKVTEGNQGPYKLYGNNGETFLIVIANSEEVFINGQKMTRGADRDYVIDYNIGTITFTPRRIITKDLRVTVEFEYSEKNYQRTLFNVNIEWQYKKLATRFNLYTEQDSKNQSVQQNLDDNKKQYLASIGDSVNTAYYPGYDTASYDPNRILYEKIDTFFVSNADTFFTPIFVQSGNKNASLYSVTFSLIGDGLGEYVAANNTANGRVYSYSPPIYNATTNTWKNTGSYLPVIKLVTPKLTQMYTFAADYAISKEQKISAEGALSNFDVNTFSKLDKKDNLGGAAQISYKADLALKKDSNELLKTLKIEANYEYVNNKFRVIERYRNIEFSRDFNLQTTQFYNEHLAFVNTTFWSKKLGTVGYKFRTFIQDSVYKGFENVVYTNFNFKNTTINTNVSLLNSKTKAIEATFLRPKINVNYTIPKTKGWMLNVGLNHEINQVKTIANNSFDTLNSHIWQNYSMSIKSPDSIKNKYTLEYTFRSEQTAKNLHFNSPNFYGHTILLNGQINTIKRQNLSWTLTYRRVDYSDTAKQKNELHNYYLGRIDYSIAAIKGFLRYNTFYEIGAGREQKTQIFYLVSPTNTGDYIYQGDLNRNGIKDITEFQPTKFKTGNDTTYLKTYTVTNEFFPVNSVQFNQSIQLNPAAIIKKDKGFMRFLSRFSIMSSLLVNKKVYALSTTKTGQLFNPFPESKLDSNLVAINLSNRNSIFFNRTSPKFSAELNINFLRNKTLLTSGFENKSSDQQSLITRWNIYKGLSWNATFTNGIKSNYSDFYASQQFSIGYQETVHEISYTHSNFLRVGLNYSFAYKNNKIDSFGGQKAKINQLTFNAKFTRLDKTVIEAAFTYAAVKYTLQSGDNIQAQYAMLEGLVNGQNFIWNLSIEQRLMSGVQLLLGYDGRKIGTNKIIHTGRAEVRALF